MRFNQIFVLPVIAIMLSGCASSGHRAPIVELGDVPKKAAATATPQKDAPQSKITRDTPHREKAPQEKDWRPQVHVVQKGDTLYSIAFNYGLGYHELAELNGIQNPGMISIGQVIRLFPGGVAAVGKAENKQTGSKIKEQPKVVKYAYSDAAMAQIDKVQSPGTPVAAKPENKTPETNSKAEQKQDDAIETDEEITEWSMPTQGKLIGEFSESANRKGIDIAGKRGQPILASAPGKVVYSGNGLRGYGKLVIIKHNKTYLSAYAHNDQVLVKEGQTITRGQKIAEMGNTDADQTKLHFEVRRFGKPVDPAKYLSLGKS
jgi:lipoprotein NlpD